mmetsp:Transcript_66890/g.199020  ORF Transcript_66890/g.199020 Transcript_66890/m.199020 type:complete len:209 (+) Transcript_66890:269-895(+)
MSQNLSHTEQCSVETITMRSPLCSSQRSPGSNMRARSEAACSTVVHRKTGWAGLQLRTETWSASAPAARQAGSKATCSKAIADSASWLSRRCQKDAARPVPRTSGAKTSTFSVLAWRARPWAINRRAPSASSTTPVPPTSSRNCGTTSPTNEVALRMSAMAGITNAGVRGVRADWATTGKDCTGTTCEASASLKTDPARSKRNWTRGE